MKLLFILPQLLHAQRCSVNLYIKVINQYADTYYETQLYKYIYITVVDKRMLTLIDIEVVLVYT